MLMNESRIELHRAYFRRCLQLLPNDYQSIDTSRVTALYFCLSALSLLSKDSADEFAEYRGQLLEWLYSLQVQPSISEDAGALRNDKCGFRGSPFAGNEWIPLRGSPSVSGADTGHLAMTYAALLCLLLLGDDLSAVNRVAIISWMRQLQMKDGSFIPFHGSREADMRFLYCACATSYILNDWTGLNRDLAVSYIKSSLSYDYGFGQGPDQESHGGSTYCAIASLHLMNRLTEVPTDKILRWCIHRQVKGFQGRVNKPEDTCYAFWIGATLQLLDGLKWVDDVALRDFLSLTATNYGGHGKEPDDLPDVLHSYMGLAGFALLDSDLHGALNLPKKTVEHLLHDTVFHKT